MYMSWNKECDIHISTLVVPLSAIGVQAHHIIGACAFSLVCLAHEPQFLQFCNVMSLF